MTISSGGTMTTLSFPGGDWIAEALVHQQGMIDGALEDLLDVLAVVDEQSFG